MQIDVRIKAYGWNKYRFFLFFCSIFIIVFISNYLVHFCILLRINVNELPHTNLPFDISGLKRGINGGALELSVQCRNLEHIFLQV